jgi:uncharacterized protein YrrD
VAQNPPTAGHEEPPYARSTRDRVYWLRECHGFAVVRGGRRVGVVDDVVFGKDTTLPEHLLVRSGLLRRRRRLVPVSAITEIVPSEKRVVLRAQTGGRTRADE